MSDEVSVWIVLGAIWGAIALSMIATHLGTIAVELTALRKLAERNRQ